jgi:hypothetical protein
VQWAAIGGRICTATGNQGYPTIASDGSGGAYFSWSDNRNGNNIINIFAQHVLASGPVLCTDPAIGSQSTATQTQCTGGTFTPITVTATGDGLIYQWYSNTSASNSGGTSLGTSNGAQTYSYTPQASAVGTKYYYCVVSGDCGTPQTSAVSGAFINPTPTPVITGSPSNAYLVHSMDTIQYCTPLVLGHLYSWSAFGQVSYVDPVYRNCINDILCNPCGIYGAWTIKVTETDFATGCSAIATKDIFIQNP